ncbi:MAG TPA: HK97 family phage prohead protease [Actinomycetota bacterium]|nr:HK97 family phage prohead protease [Actinomycetota bacterium]
MSTLSFEGLVPYDSPAELPGFREVLRRGAFRDVLDDDAILTVGHEHGGAFTLARVGNGTLRLRETSRGLEWTAEVPDTALARHYATLAERGTFGASFSFSVAPDGVRWGVDADGRTLREILRIERLWDVSLVAWGAYPAAEVRVHPGRALELAVAPSSRRKVGVRVRSVGGRVLAEDVLEGDPPVWELHRRPVASLDAYRRRLELLARR